MNAAPDSGDVDPSTTDRADAPISDGAAVLVLGAVVASVAGAASASGLVGSWLAAWATLASLRLARMRMPRMRRSARLPILALALAAPLVTLAGRARSFIEVEGLDGLGPRLRARLALEASPALHPALVAGDRPQTFFVRAEHAHAVSVTLAPGVEPLGAEHVGHDLFRVDYDPRRHGVPSVEGRTTARLVVDGDGRAARAERAVEAVLPRAHPRVLRASPARDRACTTSEETDRLLVVDAQGLVLDRPVGDGPSDCAFAGERLAVGHRYTPEVWLLDSVGGERHIDVGVGVRALAASDDGARLAAALDDGRVVWFDVASGRIRGSLDAGGRADALAFDDTGESLVVAVRTPASLRRIALAESRVTHTRALAAPAVFLARVGGGARVVIATTDAPDRAGPNLGNHYVEDQLVELGGRDLTLLRRIPTARRSPRQDAAGSTDQGVSPFALDEGTDGAWWIVFAGSDELVRLDPDTLAREGTPLAGRGLAAPVGIATLRGGALAVTSPASGRIALFSGLDHRIDVALEPPDRVLLAQAPDALARRFGERAFFETTRAGIACQSCHLHGESDGVAHNIGGRVAAPTLDVRGLAGTPPFLRDGSYPRLGDLHEVAETLYRGHLEPAPDRRATLDAWLASLPLPPARSRDPGAERRGYDAFRDAGCVDCHPPPAFTDLGLRSRRSVFPHVNAPAGAAIDTPSLRAVAARSRWLFDGRARRLGDVLRLDTSGRHGHADRLSREAQADLLAFLESL